LSAGALSLQLLTNHCYIDGRGGWVLLLIMCLCM
jgi:hypothetical protein